VQRYSEISILKALGYPKKSIIQIFSFQGILIGCLGLTGGTFIGWGFCYILTWMMKTWDLLPKSVYHLNSIELEIRPSDYIVISIVTLGICFIATLAPALRGSKLEPVEGLRYE
jgi:lipoprotein-releasing system permease protein